MVAAVARVLGAVGLRPGRGRASGASIGAAFSA